ncbi:MAG: SGNH/GDSL hydrolase family protein [Alphaproteobacteria bacterium]|nr:SGNH/GDSL hydrolase family protein [Alphaproteobacteria bacterium]
MALFLLFSEFVVFRFVLPGSDVPANAFINEVVRYAPNQRGIWRVRDEIAAPYAINARGWNSGVGDYRVARIPGIPRIAVVGDSFIEALQVPHDRSMGEDLAGLLGTADRPLEVYRFGISGAPMSQYLQMAEHEVAQYRPDWLIVQIVHNDFDESYKFKPGRYTSSFLKLRVEDGRVAGEIPPQAWHPGATEWLRRTATARFFLYRWQVRPEFLIDLLLPKAHAAPAEIAANSDIGAILADRPGVEAVTDYLFGRLDAVARAMGARLLLAMDGDRFAIYAGVDSPALELNRIAAAAAARRDLPFVDLEPAFVADWQTHHQRFDFDADHHWNEHGHAVAAAAVAVALRAQGWRP